MFAIDPPIVPLFLTCGSPIPSAKAAKEGMAFLTSFEWATSACFVVAPIVTVLPLTFIPDNFFILLISIISLYEANPNFIEGRVVIPPAKKAELDEASFVASFTSLVE